ncbi:MAG: hypothetical protein AAF840_18300, partial [Bacteroidota bacterium]
SRCGAGSVTLQASPPSGAFGLSFQWYDKNGSAIPGATQRTYTTPSLSSPTNYSVRVRDPRGCFSLGTNVLANISTKDRNPVISATNATYCPGASLPVVSVSSEASGLTYQWQWRYANSNGSWNNAGGATFSPTPLTFDRNINVRRVGTGAPGCTVYSNTVLLRYYGDLRAGTIGSNTRICPGADGPTLGNNDASGGDGNYTYQWRRKPENGSWSDIPNATRGYLHAYEIAANH